jgi:signal transduction histidine kinase
MGPRGGKLILSTAPVGGMIDLCVRDNGGGVAEPERVFEMNYSKGKPGGHGLGLYVARTLMHDCGGDLRLRNFANDGAAFILSFRRLGTPVVAHGLRHGLATSPKRSLSL